MTGPPPASTGALDRLLFGPGPEGRLALAQRCVAAVVGLRVALGPYQSLAGQPQDLWRPRGVTHVLGGMPSARVVLAAQVVGVLAAAVVACGPARWRGRRVAFAAAWASLVLLAGMRTSLGKIMHNDVLLLLVAVPLLASTFEARVGGRRRAPAYGWPLRAATVVIAGSYFFTGWQKLLHSGLAWVTSDNMQNVMTWAAVSGRAPTGLSETFADHLLLTQAVAAAVLALEVGFPAMLVWSRLAPAYAFAASAFHAGCWVLLGLDYWTFVAVDLAVLWSWPAVTALIPDPAPV